MQTLKIKSGRPSGVMAALKNQKGFVLLGAVVISVILAICAAGLIVLARNTNSLSVDAYEEMQTFLAAEAGLHIGTSWYISSPNPPQVGDGFDIVHARIPVRVEIQEFDEDQGKIRITSTANLKSLPYTKTLEWAITESEGEGLSSGHFGYFIDDAHSGKGATNFGNYQGFRATSVFDCPVHFNGPLWVKNNDSPIFRGFVSLRNPPKTEGGGYYNSYDPELKSARNKGQYNKGGLSFPNGSSPENNQTRDIAGALDAVFQNKLNVTEELYGINFAPQPTAPPDADGVVTDANGIKWWILPKSSNGTNSLTFNGTDAIYKYNVPDGKGTKEETIKVPIPQDEGKEMIINADFELRVMSGNMTGVVSVRTTPGNDLLIDLSTGSKNLTYTGVSVNGGTDKKNINYGVGNDRADLMAFYSGKDLRLTDAGNHQITAQLMAKVGQVVIPNFNSGNKNYTYSIVGNMIAKYWWNYSNAGTFDNCLQLWHDQRMLNAPGVTLTSDMGGDGSFGGNVPAVFEKTLWKETNIARK
jgi:hypothetical protein